MIGRGLVVGALVVGCTASVPASAPAVVVKEPEVLAPVVVEEAKAVKPEVPPEVLALQEARRLFGKKEHAGAWAIIKPAAEVARSDGRLQCEAGYIGFHAGQFAAAEALLRAGIGLLGRDNTGPGRKGRAMCLYNLALVQEQAGTLGEALCSLRRSEALRPNRTVAARREAIEAKVGATEFRCKPSRSARTRDVRALAREYAEPANLKITSAERTEAGEFVVHTVHLDPNGRSEDELVVYADVQYVVLERSGELAPLGVLGYDDDSITWFRGGGSWRFVGVRPAKGGTLALFERDSWWRGDSEEIKGGYGFSSHSRSDLLMCRWAAAPSGSSGSSGSSVSSGSSGSEGSEVECAQVPLAAHEEVESADPESTTGGPEGRTWGASVDYVYDEAGGAVRFTLDEGRVETASGIGLPLEALTVAELFSEFAVETVGLSI